MGNLCSSKGDTAEKPKIDMTNRDIAVGGTTKKSEI